MLIILNRMGNMYKPLPESIGIKALAEWHYTDFRYGLVLVNILNIPLLKVTTRINFTKRKTHESK